MLCLFTLLAAIAATTVALNPPKSRTTAPAGALIVRADTTTKGEFATLIAAVAALPADSSAQTIFMFAGTYSGQVLVERSGPVTIMGFTTNAGNVSANQVNITASIPVSTAGSGDASGTLRIHTDNVKLYNLNIRNDFGVGSQAIALSNYGNQVGVYACGLYGFQDTLLTQQGVHVYLQGYIQGATDFIFGQRSQAYIEGNTIAISSAGYITADGRSSNDSGIYLMNRNTIVLSPKANSNATKGYYFGRPWRDWARVIYKSTVVIAPINPAVWKVWNASTPNTDHVTYADFNTTGAGFPSTVSRANFSSQLTASQAAAYTITSALGSTWEDWVDQAYLF
ncbi:carbohydrate esterase family 8 protein [Auriscalpium vulgare]|uniref:Carbohydrate esterase family 8 protein n=1 Tax=Auriscalpium vulgare TaxID=40419 RepID=A0ACB8RLQ4_9AGAM|nr:carbohydrate esterase family 8 protein [Auriscalpium vulgare]